MSEVDSSSRIGDNRYVTRVTLGEDFTTNKEVITYMMSDDNGNGAISAAVSATGTSIIKSLPAYSQTPKRRDTMLGGNDAVNCYYQFNESDDLIHEINRTNITDTGGMGRVYNETFDEQQQILYMSFGIPDFTRADKFLEKSYNTDLATLMNTGESANLVGKIGKFIGKVAGTVIALPLKPIKWALDLFSSEACPTKYYDFRPTMGLYYKSVNVILAMLAVNMNLTADESIGEGAEGIPSILKKHGLDILTILSRKNWYDKLGEEASAEEPRTDEMLKKLLEDPLYEANAWANLKEGVSLGFTEAMRYVGFRIEKSTDSQESASNATKEPNIVSMINNQVSSGRDTAFTYNSFRQTGVGGAVDSVYKGVEGVVSGMAEGFGIQGGVEMLKGSGFIDIPEMWSHSTFQKSYHFEFQLRTPYGDPYSIFYSLYVPLAMLIAAAFPRSVGQNAYTSPYLVRAYCQGMFAIPLGIIDSITITRGAPEYGWSHSMLPTCINVNFTVKDLSPVMHVAIADGGIDDWLSILGQNSTFQEYMMTLAGSNIADRSLKLKLIESRKEALIKIAGNNKFNPLMFGFGLAETKLGRAITSVIPVSRLPGAVPKASG